MGNGKDLEKRNDGSYALDTPNKKMSVTTSSGQHSVLFEDIASTSYNMIEGVSKREITNKNLFWGGIAAAILGPVFASLLGALSAIMFFGGIIAVFLSSKNVKKTWDNVTVETRGGKTVCYSVDSGQGKVDMDAIEDARRN
tara:strand:+ start:43 stop:465 length:423 start_codon:yes stop_codon:yes gene_type:complete